MEAVAYALANDLSGTYVPVATNNKANCPISLTTYGGYSVGAASRASFTIGSKGYYSFSQLLYMYDPVLNAWTQKASNPNANRATATTADSFVLNGKGYLIGGMTSSLVPLNGVEMYDPVTNTWTTKASLATARHGSACAACGGFGYAIGGASVESIERYNDITNTWQTLGATFPAGMGNRRDAHNFKDVGIFILMANNDNIFGSLYYYDIALQTVTSRLSTPTKQSENPGYLKDNKLRILGGMGYAGGATSGVHEYDIPSNTWSSAFSSLPTPLKDYNPLYIDGSFYMLMGNIMRKYEAEHIIINGLESLMGYLITH